MVPLSPPAFRQPQWPDDLLDVAALGDAWRPRAFQYFVLKVHSRCNLACDYCYVYEMADQSWRGKPRTMPDEVVVATARRVAEHASAHGLDHVQVVLHGGEPLLAGTAFVERVATVLRETVPSGTEVRLVTQTNGLLLDDAMLETLGRHGVQVGVSLDGGADANDRHRRHADGRPSHAGVAAALERLRRPEHRHLYAGLLCTVDTANDPVRVYEDLLAHEPPTIDFLLPHGNWTTPPPGLRPGSGETPYADWLIAAFDRWYGAPRKETRVRLFEDTMSLLLGGAVHGSEQIGVAVSAVLVVDADGSLEQVDTLKSAYDGAPATGLSVHDTPFDTVLRHPSVVARQIGVEALSEQCRGCRVRDVCGGGYYPHRYREDTGFLHPSVYCDDLMVYIDHVRARLTADLAKVRVRRTPGEAAATGVDA